MELTRTKKYFAHSSKTLPIDKWHLLEDHLYSTASTSSQFAELFNSSEWALICGMLHDIGKYSEKFQKYIISVLTEENSIQKVDHSTAGAQLVNALAGGKGQGKILASIIAGHHSGLLDFISSDGAASLYNRLNKDIENYSNAPICINSNDILKLTLPEYASKNPANLFIWMKMLYSTLVDADFLDTECFMNYKKYKNRNINNKINKTLLDLLKEYTNNLNTSRNLYINKFRDQVLDDCIKASDLRPGFFSLTAPTGVGKTLSSLRFALEHAIKYNKDRIIYAIPFTSIIEQNADVFKKIIGELNIIEHHCNYTNTADKKNNSEYTYNELASENWDAPIIVTTNVQLFESLFSCKPSRCRKLHNIINSVIILDEAQFIPRHILLPTLNIINILVTDYNCTIVLCTATQPALIQRDGFEYGLKNVREIINDPVNLYKAMKRVKFTNIGNITHDYLINDVLQHEQALVIVNTRKYAKILYDALKIQNKMCFHLSTLMCPIKRTETLSKIRNLLKNKEQCLIISTSLIEAGVDIDLPVVYRSMCGLDSIIQAAGRCNRENKLNNGDVFIFSIKEDNHPGIYDQIKTCHESIKTTETIDSLDTIYTYFNRLLWKAGEKLDSEGINKLIEIGKRAEFPFKSISDKYTVIDNNTTPIIIPLTNEVEKLLNYIRITDIPSRSIMRTLQRYSVSVYKHELDKLISGGHVEYINDKYAVLINKQLYSEETGLNILIDEDNFLCV